MARVYREEIKDLGDAGCRFIQIDEVNLAYLCDPALRDQAKSFGEDPDELPKTYAKVLDKSVAQVFRRTWSCRCTCAAATSPAPGWLKAVMTPIAELLFNGINIDVYYLEYDSARAGGFEPLRFLPKGKIAVLGLMTTKDKKLETKDELKRRIDEAAKFAPARPAGALSPQCGFSPAASAGNVMDHRGGASPKLKLLVDVTKDVWGTS